MEVTITAYTSRWQRDQCDLQYYNRTNYNCTSFAISHSKETHYPAKDIKKMCGNAIVSIVC